MKLRHKTPCRECPWRVDSPAGWLGGHPAEYYADAVAENEIPACHIGDVGPASPATSYCAGALIAGRNACLLPYSAEDRAASTQVERSPGVFRHPRDFYLHHTGQPYTTPLLRRLAQADALE